MRLISRLRSLPSGTLTPLEMTVIFYIASGFDASGPTVLRDSLRDPRDVAPGSLAPLGMTVELANHS